MIGAVEFVIYKNDRLLYEISFRRKAKKDFDTGWIYII